MITTLTIWVLLALTPIKQHEMEYYTTQKACTTSAKFYNEGSPREIVYVCEERKVRK